MDTTCLFPPKSGLKIMYSELHTLMILVEGDDKRNGGLWVIMGLVVGEREGERERGKRE